MKLASVTEDGSMSHVIQKKHVLFEVSTKLYSTEDIKRGTKEEEN